MKMAISQGIITMAAACALVATSAVSASAETQPAPEVTDATVAANALAAINNVDPDLLASAVAVSATPDQEIALDAATADSSIIIPTDASENVIFSPSEGTSSIAVELPFAAEASDAVSTADGVVVYDNNNGSTTVPIVREDGGVQINTVINAATAPTDYSYSFVLPSSATIVSSGDALLFVDGDKLLGGLAPAWAKDAAGRDVPTRYEVEGATVTQIVEHDQSYSYPVVADPWIGINLFSSITVDSYNSQPRVNLNLSNWGWSVYSGAAQGGGLTGIAAGQAILNTAGWDEAWGKGGTIRTALDKPSQRQQFSCHALGAVAAGTWNLEKFRPNRTNGDWGFGVAVHHCNWTTANQY
ncbi:hypothetical protein [Leifsonia sp. Root4]|uniref:hypothetical protein n=1 Tax=Leifsonia sp. Root4 TaxID=1736525 RepID=UPI000AB901A2|nr:hypothetical protein [Leifsonia sp. Root4]